MPTLTRQALYDLVWAEPVRTVAERFGLSDNGLKKICVKADVPVPERGYWAKLAADKNVLRRPLPPRGVGMPHDISIGVQRTFHWPPDPVAELAEPVPDEPIFDEPLTAVEDRIRRSVKKIAALKNFDRTHHEIRKLITKDDQRREKWRNSRYPSSWDEPYFDSPFEQRRLKVLNSLFLGLAEQWAKPWVRGHQARELGVGVGCQQVSFTLDHPSAKPNRHGEAVIHGGKTDTLKLQVRSSDEGGQTLVWRDEDDRKIETRLTEIVVALLLHGEWSYRASCIHRYRYALERREEMKALLVQQKAEAEAAERKRRADEEKRQRGILLHQARDWRQAADLRAFIATVEAGQAGGDGLEAWASWARGIADRLDPLTSSDFAAMLPVAWLSARALGSVRDNGPEGTEPCDTLCGVTGDDLPGDDFLSR
ncbi:MAG: hypothetical protein GC155_08250 [Alphaproteobacteria bacterium]|nr:hypothetical protein [Alphaproteobacteria bacterium]